MASLILLVAGPLMAAEGDDVQDETSTLTSAAQAEKAENLAEASQAEAADDVAAAQADVDSAQVAVAAEPDNLELQVSLEILEAALSAAEASLETSVRILQVLFVS